MMSPLLPAERAGRSVPAAASMPMNTPTTDMTSLTTTPGGRKKRARKLTNSERGKLYRSRRKTYVSVLEEDVELLKQEVDALQLRRSSAAKDAFNLVAHPQWSRMDLAGGSLSMATVEHIVHEYFSQFEHGIPLLGHGGFRGDERALSTSTQAQFLNGVMHPDLLFANLPRGVGTLLEQWARYTTYHTVLEYELSRLEVVACDPLPVVHAPATLRVRFSRTTIEKIFPHVLWNEALVQKLIGLEVSYPVGNTFYFGEDQRIVRYDTWVDFVAAFVGVLGSISDSMQLLESAYISDEALIGERAIEAGATKAEQGEPVTQQEHQRRVEMDHTRAAMSLRAIL